MTLCKVMQVLTGTLEHPFMTPSGWVGMGKLGIGTEILTRAGPRLVVKSRQVKHFANGIAVYNFTVDGEHTYFVGTANGGAWVHNTNCANPAVNEEHIFNGAINARGNAVGFHRESIQALGKARVAEYRVDSSGNRVVGANGVYEGRVEVYDPNSGNWVAKTGNGGWSSFFPRDWSESFTRSQILWVYNNGTHTGNRFYGRSPSGVEIRGFTDSSGNITTAYPVFSP